MTHALADVEKCVDLVLEHGAGRLRLATPLGLGKPNRLLNALYRRARADPGIELDVYTALSLARPQPHSELERRFIEPFLERHFGADYPDLAWIAAQHAGALPHNVRIHEFYLQSGAMLGVVQAQCDYTSLNYTHVARDLVPVGINAIVQLVALRRVDGTQRCSLSCNPDVTFDLLDRIQQAGGPRPLVVGVAHPDLPFIGNEAAVDVDFFDVLLREPGSTHELFALPREPVDVAEHALGLHASTLVRDGGTLQIGIGALSDALVYSLRLRHADNHDYRAALAALGVESTDVARVGGGLDPFVRGLYGASEMVMDGFMHLARAGILVRRVYDDYALERALADGVIGETLPTDAADRLHACGVLPPQLDAAGIARLVRFGLLPEGTHFVAHSVALPDDSVLPADLREAAARSTWNRVLAGRRLRDGRYLRGAFFLGSKEFYSWLRELHGDAFEGLSMTRVSDINQLYGGRETLDALQRRNARFYNTCMIATLLGAAASDTLENGQVVSGVGGQYNFVAMAHALEDGRSVLMLRSCRRHAGATHSNLRWRYGQATIPRHLRDIFVTEYGIADLRGKSDQDCILAMLAISDARFQPDLVRQAKADGKLRGDFAIPPRWRENTPERLAAALTPWIRQGRFARFPFGSDFDSIEQRLLPALRRLQMLQTSKPKLAAFLLGSMVSGRIAAVAPALMQRMGLDRPHGLRERLWRRLLARALVA